MATKDTFTVNVKGGTGVVAEYMAPDSIGDAEWHNRIDGDHTKMVTIKCSAAVANAVNELAVQNWVIKAQGSARASLPKGKAAVQAAVARYRYGAKGRSAPSVRVDATMLGLSRAQIDALTAQGAEVYNIPAGV